jgi:hypothetical protein
MEDAAEINFCRDSHMHFGQGEWESMRMRDLYKPSLWGLMQQHGAPTRMLDWTWSPYIAAYFAALDDYSEDGCVWAFKADALVNAEARAKRPSLDEKGATYRKEEVNGQERSIRVCNMVHPTQRMLAQQGFFTVSNDVLADHEKTIEEMLEPEGMRNCFRIRITGESKIEFLDHLDLMNVRASVLFPGVDGVGRGVAEQLRRVSPREEMRSRKIETIMKRDVARTEDGDKGGTNPAENNEKA